MDLYAFLMLFLAGSSDTVTRKSHCDTGEAGTRIQCIGSKMSDGSLSNNEAIDQIQDVMETIPSPNRLYMAGVQLGENNELVIGSIDHPRYVSKISVPLRVPYWGEDTPKMSVPLSMAKESNAYVIIRGYPDKAKVVQPDTTVRDGTQNYYNMYFTPGWEIAMGNKACIEVESVKGAREIMAKKYTIAVVPDGKYCKPVKIISVSKRTSKAGMEHYVVDHFLA